MTTPSVVEFWADHGGQSITPLLRIIADSWTGDLDTAAAMDKALELRPDFTSAAWAAGWYYEADQSEWRRTNDETSDGYDYANTAETACRMDNNVVLAMKELEHPTVSTWLGEQLERYDERVVDVAGVKLWVKSAEIPALEHPALIAIAQTFQPEAAPTRSFR